MPDLTTTQAKWACAMLERECPGEYHHLTGEGPPCCLAYTTRVPIPDCGGTKRIPLLPGVREECDPEICVGGVLVVDDLPFGRKGDKHKHCHGLGFTPTDNAWKWTTSVGKSLLSAQTKINLGVATLDGEASFFTALLEALLPLAVNGDATVTWVKERINGNH